MFAKPASVCYPKSASSKSGFTAFSSAFPAGNLSFCSVKAISGSDLSACTGE